MKPIPVNETKLDGNESKYLMEAIESGWISSEGPFVSQFEEQCALRHDRKHAIAVSSGTAALHCAVNALDLSPEDEVIVPSFTIISCVTPVIESGATPVLVDCDPKTFNSSPEQIISAITPRTKAIMLVHIYGLPVDADPVLEIARERGIQVIEDAAEAIGLKYKDRPCGSLGNLSTFSFYPNKHITTGEGGMVLTNDDQIDERCRASRNLCFQNSKRFYHERIGWNFRMTNIQAAIGVAQLERLDETIARKREIGAKYSDLLKDCPFLQLPVPETFYAKNVYWVYPVVLHDSCTMNATEVMSRLEQRQIGTRPFFYPMHKQPVFNKLGLFENDSHHNAERIAERGFYIPSGLGISDNEIHRVADTLLEMLKH
jgi:perosamine synthetase